MPGSSLGLCLLHSCQRFLTTDVHLDISKMPDMSDSQDISFESGPQSPPPATSTPLRQSESRFPSQFSASSKATQWLRHLLSGLDVSFS